MPGLIHSVTESLKSNALECSQDSTRFGEFGVPLGVHGSLFAPNSPTPQKSRLPGRTFSPAPSAPRPKSLHRIYPQGPPRRQETRSQPHHQEKASNHDESDGIGGDDLEEHPIYQAGGSQYAGDSQDRTDADQRHSSGDDQAKDARSRSAQGDPDPNLLDPFGDEKGQHSVKV
jgi:hypothetical protein